MQIAVNIEQFEHVQPYPIGERTSRAAAERQPCEPSVQHPTVRLFSFAPKPPPRKGSAVRERAHAEECKLRAKMRESKQAGRKEREMNSAPICRLRRRDHPAATAKAYELR